MDNAAKALLIAGGILIGMLIISVSMYLLTSFRDFYYQNTTVLNSYQINAFNTDFTKYGPQNGVEISGADAYNIMSKVSEVNSTHDFIIYQIDDSSSIINTGNYEEYFYFTKRFAKKFDYSYDLNSDGIVNSIRITNPH